jgi:transcriptional regulator with XRE-family HTH domain
MTPKLARKYVKRSTIKQAMIARKLGVTESELSLWLHGKREPPPNMLLRIVEVAQKLARAFESVK